MYIAYVYVDVNNGNQLHAVSYTKFFMFFFFNSRTQNIDRHQNAFEQVSFYLFTT